MSEPKMISPLLDQFAVGGAVSEHHGVRCYPAIHKETQEKYFLKIISIPASPSRLQALLITGAYETEEEALEYFKTLVKETTDEVAVLKKLADLEGFLPYEACQVVEKSDETGFDIYLLSPYKKSLDRHLKKNPMTHLAAINLGLDLCACMALCRQAGYLYVDLKPSNIFLLDEKTFRIGDIGFINLNNLKYASIPDRYFSEYTAPEVEDAFSALNKSLDIYSIGFILYQIYNGGELLDKKELCAPQFADYELAEIIMKACDPDPEKRWQDPVQMGQALKSYMQRNGVNDDPIIPPPANLDDDEAHVEPFEEEQEDDDDVLFEQVDEAGQLMIEEMIDYGHSSGAEEAGEENDGSAAGNGEENFDDEDDPANLSFLDDLVSDETAPGDETVAGVTYSELSDEASDILSYADDLIAMEVPPPVVAPEVTELNLNIGASVTEENGDEEAVAGAEDDDESKQSGVHNPGEAGEAEITEGGEEDEAVESVVTEGEEDNENGETSDDDAEDDDAPPAVSSGENDEEDDASEATPVFEGGDTKVIPSGLAAQSAAEESDEDEAEEEESESGSNLFGRILAFVLAGLILICLVIGGLIFYREYYLKTVHSMTLDGFEDRLSVNIVSTADESLLTVVCTDTYGNKLTAPVVNGTASLGGLNADTLYTVSVEISGFHALAGKLKETYTTAPRTEIATFSAITGAEAGSVILSFTVSGQDSNEWTVTYLAEGEQEKSETFTGHMITVSGLTIGKTYTFTLESTDDLFVVGNNSVEYSAKDLIYAENLRIDNCTEEGLTIKWNAPAGTEISGWTALCYNTSGYSQTLTTEDTSATFTGVDPKSAYTVEVTAAGMSVSSRCYMTENAVAATNITAVPGSTTLDLSWNYTGTTPGSKWVVLYSYSGSNVQQIVRSESTSVQIYPVIPGVTYDLTISLEDGTTVFSGTTSVEIPAAEDFVGYLVSKSDMTFQMCLAPDGDDWTWRNVSTYKETFKAGETAGFVMRLSRPYHTSPDIITVLYVIKDENGAIVETCHTAQTWTSMWYQRYGELELPSIPTVPGNYTMDIYFSGAHVHTQEFTVE